MIRKADIYLNGNHAGVLKEQKYLKEYVFIYDNEYRGNPISVTMPVRNQPFIYAGFPPFFDGLLPEGVLLEGLLKQKKIDKNDLFSQLIAIGNDTVGAVTIKGC